MQEERRKQLQHQEQLWLFSPRPKKIKWGGKQEKKGSGGEGKEQFNPVTSATPQVLERGHGHSQHKQGV